MVVVGVMARCWLMLTTVTFPLRSVTVVDDVVVVVVIVVLVVADDDDDVRKKRHFVTDT